MTGERATPLSARCFPAWRGQAREAGDTRKGDACLHTLEGHTNIVNSVCSFDGGARLASGSDDGTVKLWDAQNGACLQTLEGGSGYTKWVKSVCSFDGGTQIASGSRSGIIKLWG